MAITSKIFQTQPQDPHQSCINDELFGIMPTSFYTASVMKYGFDIVRQKPPVIVNPSGFITSNVVDNNTSLKVAYDWGDHYGILVNNSEDILNSGNSVTFLISLVHHNTVMRPFAGYYSNSSDVTILGGNNGSADTLVFHFGNQTYGAGGGAVVATSFTPVVGSITRYAFVASPSRGREIWRDGKLVVADSSANFTRNTTTQRFDILNTAANAGAGSGTDILEFLSFTTDLNGTVLREWTGSRVATYRNNSSTDIISMSSGFPAGQRLHYVVYPATETRTPQQDDIVKGWPGVGVTSGYEKIEQSANPKSFSADASGLTASTNYKIAYVWYDGLNYSNSSTVQFSTGAGGSGIPVLSAVTLYDVTTTTARPRVTITFS